MKGGGVKKTVPNGLEKRYPEVLKVPGCFF